MNTRPKSNTWICDSEWGYRDDLIDAESAFVPVVICFVCQQTGERVSFWGRDAGLQSFMRTHKNDIFVAHNIVAELKYLMRLGCEIPSEWQDTYVLYRCLHNRPGFKEKAGLSYALHAYGLPNMAPAEKDDLRMRILHLRFDPKRASDQQEITAYCFEDCAGCLALYQAMETQALEPQMRHWATYQAVVARMELRGVPFDTNTHRMIVANKRLIKTKLIEAVNSTCPVYVNGVFKKEVFLQYFEGELQKEWPRKTSVKTGKLYAPVDDDTFKAMEHEHPFVLELKEVRKTLSSFSNRELAIDGETKRHYFSTHTFAAVTSRNQPKGFVFSSPKWMRYLIQAESDDHVLVYADYTAQEIGIAAALSKDANMKQMYEADDPHLDFAIRAGAAPSHATKPSHPKIRKIYKTANLGLQYGQTAYGIAQSLGISKKKAQRIVDEHQSLFAEFWSWSEAMVKGCHKRGWIATPCGWRSIVPRDHKLTTWRNWPMQATGADIMRLTAIYLDQQGVQLLALVHDGFLMTCRREELEHLRRAVDFACSTAVEQVLPEFKLRWDFEVFEDRFEDEDGRPLWLQMRKILAQIEKEKSVAN